MIGAQTQLLESAPTSLKCGFFCSQISYTISTQSYFGPTYLSQMWRRSYMCTCRARGREYRAWGVWDQRSVSSRKIEKPTSKCNFIILLWTVQTLRRWFEIASIVYTALLWQYKHIYLQIQMSRIFKLTKVQRELPFTLKPQSKKYNYILYFRLVFDLHNMSIKY